MKKVFLSIFAVLVLLPLGVRGEGSAQKGFSSSVFLFHLYYDQGQLFADRDFQFKYDILIEPFQEENVSGNVYQGEIIGKRGQALAYFRFDPQKGNPHFTKGKISVKAPFFADAREVNFYDGQSQKLLTISVVESSFCNDNGVCEATRGEDEQNCPVDCTVATVSLTPTPSYSSPPFSDRIIDFLNDFRLLAAGGAAGLVLVGWLLFKWLKNRKNNALLPPQI